MVGVAESRVIEAPSARRFYPGAGKRMLDLGLTTLLALIWVPLYLLIALALLISQGRPIHYRSARPGRDLEPFTMFKFRTMRPGSDDELDEILRADENLQAEYMISGKLRSDPRVTPFGTFLRKTSLDELPQLLNVLRGDMSLVGPRSPATYKELHEFYGNDALTVFQTSPGLTGPWQVSGRAALPYTTRIQLDLDYRDQCGLKTDLVFVIRTIPAVLRGDGAF
ncbi:MAG TPA: sugar transferase [Actinomycetota bacterium]|nr:sugar transferase [Actinomycetota bacterium]